jgi:hypothetical protein
MKKEAIIMSIRKLKLVVPASLLLMSSMLIAAPQTLTGTITDDMCGKKHTMMRGKPDSECIRACVKSGSKYALLSSNKVLVLKGDNKQFEQLSAKKVKVTGEVSDATVTVTSVTEAK